MNIPNPNMMQMNPGFNVPDPRLSLYVGDIDESLHEEHLYDFFSKIAKPASVRILKERFTGKSRGFGFVNFKNPKDAELVLQKAQYARIGRKQIRMMFQSDIKNLPQDANVFVRNIDPYVTVAELHSYFAQVKPVISAKISTNSDGKSRGYGYVQFHTKEDAEAAIEALNGTRLKNSEIELSVFIDKNDRLEDTVKKTLYVKDFPADKKAEELEEFVRAIFTPYGEIETLLINKHRTEEKYSAIVCFREDDSALFAYNDIIANPRYFKGSEKPLYVNWHQDRSQRAQEFKEMTQNQNTLYVKNLLVEVEEAEIKDAFQQYGPILGVNCRESSSQQPNNPNPARFALIFFKNPEDAKTAQTEAAGSEAVQALFINNQPYINIHQPKDKRNQFLKSRNVGIAQTNAYNNMMSVNPYMMQSYGYQPNFQPMMYPYGMMNPMNPMQMGQMNPMGGGGGYQHFQKQQGGYKKGGPDDKGNNQGGYQHRQQGGYQNRQDRQQGGGYQDRQERQQDYQERQQERQQRYQDRQQGGYQDRQQRYQERQEGQERQQGYQDRQERQQGGFQDRQQRYQERQEGQERPHQQGGFGYNKGHGQGHQQYNNNRRGEPGQYQNRNQGQNQQQHQQHQHQHQQQQQQPGGQQRQFQESSSPHKNLKPEKMNLPRGNAQVQSQADLTRGPVTLQILKNNVSAFVALPSDRKRQILGELMFPQVQPIAGEYAPRITGMLIDLSILDLPEILEMLEDNSILQERVEEAKELIMSEDQ